MRKQFVKSVENLLSVNENVSVLLGDISVFAFRESLKKYPDRVFNIGILEQSTIGISSGLSKIGIIPIVHTISPFMIERGFEQIKIDFGYQNLNGNFVGVGYSFDYSTLGCTHHCPGDVGILNTIPNMEIILPGTSKEFDILFNQCYDDGSPTYYRLSERENEESRNVNFGKGMIIKKGNMGTIITTGNMLDDVLESSKDLDVTILYYTTIKPFDYQTLLDNFNEKIILCEPYYEGTLNYYVNKLNKKVNILNIGIENKFINKYGKYDELKKYLGLDVENIKKRIINFIGNVSDN